MAQDNETFLRRWSRLKREEEKKASAPQKTEASSKEEAAQAKAEAPPLPPVETLTPQSDFTPFMHPKVTDAVRRVALKKLFNDPHFNVIDPNEPFSGDWTVAEPIGPDLMKTLNQARTHLLNDEEREQHDRDELERDHAQALALDAERAAALETKEPDTDEPARKDA